MKTMLTCSVAAMVVMGACEAYDLLSDIRNNTLIDYEHQRQAPAEAPVKMQPLLPVKKEAAVKKRVVKKRVIQPELFTRGEAGFGIPPDIIEYDTTAGIAETTLTQPRRHKSTLED